MRYLMLIAVAATLLTAVGCGGGGQGILTPSGLRYSDSVVGTGAEAVQGSYVTANYTGRLVDGTKFDSTKDPGRRPFTFTVGNNEVIAGLDEGIRGMKAGGTRILTVPPALGYGANAVGSIPANSTLRFEVELMYVDVWEAPH